MRAAPYTPQMVVDGAVHFSVGIRRGGAEPRGARRRREAPKRYAGAHGDVEAELAKGRAATRLEVEEKLRAEFLGPVAALKQDREHNPNALLLARSELGL